MELLLSKDRTAQLIEKAREGMANAYAPYSGFHVGACVRTADDMLYTGCNIENASYGDTICAERTAMFKAVSEGHRDLREIAIVCDGDVFPYPCGLCRQVMAEFMPDGMVHVVCGEEVRTYTVAELLPHGFSMTHSPTS